MHGLLVAEHITGPEHLNDAVLRQCVPLSAILGFLVSHRCPRGTGNCCSVRASLWFLYPLRLFTPNPEERLLSLGDTPHQLHRGC